MEIEKGPENCENCGYQQNTKLGDTGLRHSTGPRWQEESSENTFPSQEPLGGVPLQNEGETEKEEVRASLQGIPGRQRHWWRGASGAGLCCSLMVRLIEWKAFGESWAFGGI